MKLTDVCKDGGTLLSGKNKGASNVRRYRSYWKPLHTTVSMFSSKTGDLITRPHSKQHGLIIQPISQGFVVWAHLRFPNETSTILQWKPYIPPPRLCSSSLFPIPHQPPLLWAVTPDSTLSVLPEEAQYSNNEGRLWRKTVQVQTQLYSSYLTHSAIISVYLNKSSSQLKCCIKWVNMCIKLRTMAGTWQAFNNC